MKVWLVSLETSYYDGNWESTEIVHVASSYEKALSFIMSVPNIEVTEYPPRTRADGSVKAFTTYQRHAEGEHGERVDEDYHVYEFVVDHDHGYIPETPEW